MKERQTKSLPKKLTYKTDLRNVDWKQMKTILRKDEFDNGRTPEQLQVSFKNSHSTVIAYDSTRIIGTARVLSDGVCNAYVVDVWTYSPFRKLGIGRTMMKILEENLRGQHVYLQSDDATRFYKALGYKEQSIGLSKVIGIWLEKRK